MVSIKIKRYTRDICFDVLKVHTGLSAWKSLAELFLWHLVSRNIKKNTNTRNMEIICASKVKIYSGHFWVTTHLMVLVKYKLTHNSKVFFRELKHRTRISVDNIDPLH